MITDERFTPAWVIDLARCMMGDIDLDPASCVAANMVVQAKEFYTKKENGLSFSWSGKRVWLNPPYSRGVVGKFVSKWIDEVDCGCILLNADTSTRASQAVMHHSTAILFFDHRIRFKPSKRLAAYLAERGSTTISGKFPQMLCYYGPQLDEEPIEKLTAHGFVVCR